MKSRRTFLFLLIVAWTFYAFSWTTPEPRLLEKGAALAGLVFFWLWVLFWATMSLLNYPASADGQGFVALFGHIARGIVVIAVTAVIYGVCSVTARYRFGLIPPETTEALGGNLTLLAIYLTPTVVTTHFLLRRVILPKAR